MQASNPRDVTQLNRRKRSPVAYLQAPCRTWGQEAQCTSGMRLLSTSGSLLLLAILAGAWKWSALAALPPAPTQVRRRRRQLLQELDPLSNVVPSESTLEFQKLQGATKQVGRGWGAPTWDRVGQVGDGAACSRPALSASC